MVLEERTHHPVFVYAAQVDVETAFLCNSADPVFQDFGCLAFEGYAKCTPCAVDVVTCAKLNVRGGRYPSVPFDHPFETSVFPGFLQCHSSMLSSHGEVNSIRSTCF